MGDEIRLTAAEIEALCTAGSLAPSGANAQPWQVTVRGNRLLVAPDAHRGAGGFLDVGGYGSLFGIGCFAENLHIAAGALGLEHVLASRDGTVELTVTGRGEPVADELYGYLPKRVTNRRAADHTQLAESELRRLAELVADLDTGYAITALSTPTAKRDVGQALGIADAVRMRQPALFAEMLAEICWSDAAAQARREGLDLRTLELPAGTARLLSVLRRVPSLRLLLPRARLGDTARYLVSNCSHICCLSTAAPLTRDELVAAGRAMQRLWLAATGQGISVHPWTVSTFLLMRAEVFGGAGLTAAEQVDVARVGRELRTAFGLAAGDHPVFVFRLSLAPPPAARSLRLPWQSFTTVEP
jgi:hypothetical protein